MDSEFCSACLKIIFLDLLLSGDNALVIALATRSLPPQQQKWGRILGALGAVFLRVVFVILLVTVLEKGVPYLQLVGGLLLLWIAWKLVKPPEDEDTKVKDGSTLWDAVLIIIVADVVMSFDNVLAISAAARGHAHSNFLVAFGLLLSIPLVVWGSQLLSKLMARFRWVIWLGGGILGHISLEMALKDIVIQRLNPNPSLELVSHILPWVSGVTFFALGWWLTVRRRTITESEKAKAHTET